MEKRAIFILKKGVYYAWFVHCIGDEIYDYLGPFQEWFHERVINTDKVDDNFRAQVITARIDRMPIHALIIVGEKEITIIGNDIEWYQ